MITTNIQIKDEEGEVQDIIERKNEILLIKPGSYSNWESSTHVREEEEASTQMHTPASFSLYNAWVYKDSRVLSCYGINPLCNYNFLDLKTNKEEEYF